MTGHSGPVNSAAYSPDGKSIVTATRTNRTVRIWDAATGQELRQLIGHSEDALSAAYSPDGKTIVTVGCDGTPGSGCQESSVRIWNAATGQELRRLTGYTAPVYPAAYSPDGRHILSLHTDFTLGIWVVDIEEILAQAKRLIQREPPLLTPDERQRYGLE